MDEQVVTAASDGSVVKSSSSTSAAAKAGKATAARRNKARATKTKRVALVGFAPSSRDLAPFHDQDIELWGVGEVYTVLPKSEHRPFTVDRLFELHDYGLLRTQKQRNKKHLQWLRSAKIPIYMLDHYDDIPQSVAFPKDAVIGALNTHYFTNSIAWMMGYAACEGFTEIQLFGVDMAAASEYGSQKPSCEFMIGLLRGAGITVYIPPESDLLQTDHLYGFESSHHERFKRKLLARKAELEKSEKHHTEQFEHHKAALNQVRGAIMSIDQTLANYGNEREGVES